VSFSCMRNVMCVYVLVWIWNNKYSWSQNTQRYLNGGFLKKKKIVHNRFISNQPERFSVLKRKLHLGFKSTQGPSKYACVVYSVMKKSLCKNNQTHPYAGNISSQSQTFAVGREFESNSFFTQSLKLGNISPNPPTG
jgi:hypothetical protein